MQAETAASSAQRSTMHIIAGSLLVLWAVLPLSKLVAAGVAASPSIASPATATTVAVVEHTIWTTPGELVGFRVNPEQLFSPADADQYDWTITLKGRPDAAQLLSNPDSSQSLLWVPLATDIGSWDLEFSVVGFNRIIDGRVGTLNRRTQMDNTVQRKKIRMRIEVLEGQVKLARLNALPDLLITDSRELAVQKDGLVKAALREPLQFRVIAKDVDSESPLVSLVGETVSLTAENKNSFNGDRTNIAPAGSLKADSVLVEGNTRNSGYQNFTVYAVDRRHPLQYVSQTINVLVGDDGLQRFSTSWTELDENPQLQFNTNPGYSQSPTSAAALAAE